MLPGKDKWLGNLPNLFINNKGEKVTTPEQWTERRKEILDITVDMLYGGMPPKPEVFNVVFLGSFGRRDLGLQKYSYLIQAGTKEKTISFPFYITTPKENGPFPIILTGDICFENCNDAVTKMLCDKGYAVGRFERLAIAKDGWGKECKKDSLIYEVYPNQKFGAIASWAWGYHRCIDAIETLDFIDKSMICITGHSRGGKTSLLAAATDERIAFAQDSCSGCCGGGCFRYEQYAEPEGEKAEGRVGISGNNEKLANITAGFPHWFNPDINEYIGKENELPFDQHFLMAAIAPRGVLLCNSFDDAWANPIGSYQTFCAAREAYEFLGVKNMIASNYRYGIHSHRPEEFTTFVEFIESVKEGRPFLKDNADKVVNMPKLYNWD